MNRTLPKLLREVQGCTVCDAHLPLGPRPVLKGKLSARIMIVGQAPGTRVHETGIPWNDASGRRLRAWLDLDDDTFYDETRIAIVPMGFCYPGANPKGGDNPPGPNARRSGIRRCARRCATSSLPCWSGTMLNAGI